VGKAAFTEKQVICAARQAKTGTTVAKVSRRIGRVSRPSRAGGRSSRVWQGLNLPRRRPYILQGWLTGWGNSGHSSGARQSGEAKGTVTQSVNHPIFQVCWYRVRLKGKAREGMPKAKLGEGREDNPHLRRSAF
jgi:hypothetical protein